MIRPRAWPCCRLLGGVQRQRQRLASLGGRQLAHPLHVVLHHLAAVLIGRPASASAEGGQGERERGGGQREGQQPLPSEGTARHSLVIIIIVIIIHRQPAAINSCGLIIDREQRRTKHGAASSNRSHGQSHFEV
jgi:hypothetical protein